MVLTPEQIAEFKALGYVLVPNLIDPSMLDNWRAQIRAHSAISLIPPNKTPQDRANKTAKTSPY